MKLPWYLKISKGVVRNRSLDIEVKVNPWWVRLKKLQYIMTMQISIKWNKGLRIILDNPKWLQGR
jgi:hypothetical protein